MWTVFVEGNSTTCQTYGAMPLQLFKEIKILILISQKLQPKDDNAFQG
jgi:hypothetical protein